MQNVECRMQKVVGREPSAEALAQTPNSAFSIHHSAFVVSVRMRRRSVLMSVRRRRIMSRCRIMGRRRLIVIRLSFLVMMPFRTVLDLFLHLGGRHAGRMVEHQVAAE